MVKSLIKLSIIFYLLIQPFNLNSQEKKLKHRFFSVYQFNDDENKIKYQRECSEKDIPYLKSFWLVYYNQKGQKVGEEYYKNWKLYYYHLYKYTATEVHKKTFYWYGYINKAFFYRPTNKEIFVGYIFRRHYSLWHIYDKESGRILSKSFYRFIDHPFRGIPKIDYTDRYFYNKNKLVKIERYRKRALTKVYHIKKQ